MIHIGGKYIFIQDGLVRTAFKHWQSDRGEGYFAI